MITFIDTQNKIKNILFFLENTHENTYKTPAFSGLNMSRGV